jgi:hypothetical protein
MDAGTDSTPKTNIKLDCSWPAPEELKIGRPGLLTTQYN